MKSKGWGASLAAPVLRRGMKRGKVSPLLLLVLVAIAAVAVVLYLRFGPCCPGGKSVSCPAAPVSPPAASGAAGMSAPPAAESTNLSSAVSESSSVPMVSTAAIATVASAQTVAVEQREDELARQTTEAYRKLAELRRAAQESAEIKKLHASIEADRRALDELTLSDPAIRALTDRRKALLDEMVTLQARQSELARQARADATNLTLKAEGQAAIAKIRETSTELGTVTRKWETAKRDFIGQNTQAAEIAARLSANQDKARVAVTSSPEIQAIQQQIQKLAAESRQLGLRRRQLNAAVPSADPAGHGQPAPQK